VTGTSVFISYRRSDSSSATGRIADRLKARFGENRIFFDVDTIPLGIDFRSYVGERLDKTDVFLVVIGDDWLEAKDEEGQRRIDAPSDNVHIEVAAALAREEVPVIPVLVGQATAPPSEERLPDPLRGLATRNAIPLRSDTTFEGQMERLIEYIESLSEERHAEQHPVAQEREKQAPVAAPEQATGKGMGMGAIGIGLALLLVLAIAASQLIGGGADLVTVPDVVGDSVPVATALLEDDGFEVDWDFEGERALEDVTVLETDPGAGEDVEEGTWVMLHTDAE